MEEDIWLRDCKYTYNPIYSYVYCYLICINVITYLNCLYRIGLYMLGMLCVLMHSFC